MAWNILIKTNGKKVSSSDWTHADNAVVLTNFGGVGTTSFETTTLITSGADVRNSFVDGDGVYNGFFTTTNITRLALVDGSGNLSDPSTHTNYLVYDLVESTGDESIYDILLRLNNYQKNSALFDDDDNVWGDSSVLNHIKKYIT